jgi:3-oxoacyl-[acyl-carrier protein] reductase
MELEGKVAIVTGGGRGIGQAIVLDLAANGADVVFTYRSNVAAAEEVAARIKELGRRGLAVRTDVGDFEAAQSVVNRVMDELGRLDILVNNAGVNRDAVIWKMTEAEWDEVMNTDLKGCFNDVRAAVPIFRAQNAGKIVNITSINGLRGKFGQSNYSAAKAGVIGLTKALARELGRSNININAVAPGLIETDMVKEAPEKVKEMALAEILLGRLGKPEEVAYVVTFLCTEKARHITGEVITVDGGQYL